MKIVKKLTFILLILSFGICSAQLEIPGESTIFNNNQDQYIDANDISNPIRDGAYAAIKSPDETNEISGIQGAGQKIEDHTTARERTFSIIKNLINYALGLLSLIALIYIIYHGFIILTAAGDDAKYKQGLKGVKFAAIALVGIGLSRIVVSSIFWLIFEVLLKPTI
ncbi:MAG: hypothetical protein PHR61_05225 [Candidatus Absconditabacteria bacterium]|nr:hypothetical protein [Candidatus Absconditabacteria bacterium]